MQSPDQAPGDILQVIPRHGGSPAAGEHPGRPGERSEGTGSRFIRLLPERRRRLTRVVIAALSFCGLILVAAAIAHLLRPSEADTAQAATASTPALAAPALPTAAAPAPAPAPVVPTSGTLRLKSPAAAGHVWLDGQKLMAGSASVTCGKHQVKVGARGKAHPIDIPCGGEITLSR